VRPLNLTCHDHETGGVFSLRSADGGFGDLEHSGGPFDIRHVDTETVEPGRLLKDARRRAGLTQLELARRAAVAQSVISAYESGSRQPSPLTLQRLVAATGFQLMVSLRGPLPLRERLTGPLGKQVLRHRRQIKTVAAAHGASNVRVFGSVARGQDTIDSDVDLLVDLAPETGLIALGLLERDLTDLLGVRVEVVPSEDLKAGVAAEVLVPAVAL
jgi:predicted nucleotidyltransferase/DNA-binding XRE family transcriptional regulator